MDPLCRNGHLYLSLTLITISFILAISQNIDIFVKNANLHIRILTGSTKYKLTNVPFWAKSGPNEDLKIVLCYPSTFTMLPTIIFGNKYCRSSQRTQQEIQEPSSNTEEQELPAMPN